MALCDGGGLGLPSGCVLCLPMPGSPARPALARPCTPCWPWQAWAGEGPKLPPSEGSRNASRASRASLRLLLQLAPEPVDLHPPSNLAASNMPSHLITTPIISMPCHHLIPDRGSSALPHVSRILMVIIVTITRPQRCPLRLRDFTSRPRRLLSRYLARYLGTHAMYLPCNADPADAASDVGGPLILRRLLYACRRNDRFFGAPRRDFLSLGGIWPSEGGLSTIPLALVPRREAVVRVAGWPGIGARAGWLAG